MTDKRVSARRGQFYWLKGEPFVSVTNVLKVIDKPALRYWFGKEVFLAMTQNPNLSQSEALSAPYKTSDKAKARGTTVHSIVEAYKVKQTKLDKVLKDYQGYADAFYKWVSDNKLEIIENEKTVVSLAHGYAGTLDLLVKKNGETWIVDVKTGKDIYLEAHLQLSAYKHALEESGKLRIDRTAVLLLKENGKYKFEETEDNFDVFLAAKDIWYFLNREECNKLGYGQEINGLNGEEEQLAIKAVKGGE